MQLDAYQIGTPTSLLSRVHAALGAQPSSVKPTVIIGLGRTGLSCARFLHGRGVPIRVIDSRSSPPELERLRSELPEVPVTLGSFNEHVMAGADALVVSPGVSLEEPALRHAMNSGIPVVGDIELFAYAVQAPVIAVTGSNGKSTVTRLVGAMAEAEGLVVRVGGNIGPPALALLEEPQADLFILELSSFQLETTHSLDAVAAVVLNVSEDHMDRYADLAAYTAAKQRIFRGHGVMVLNQDDSLVAAMRAPDRRTIGFTLDAPQEDDVGLIDALGGPWIVRGISPVLPVSALKLQGRANVANALAACALGYAAGFSVEAMQTALLRFRGLPHRCQWVTTLKGVHWYNDSKATNVGATLAAITGLPVKGRLVVIAGGQGKGANFRPLRKAVRGRVRAMVLMGQDAGHIAAAVSGAVTVIHVADMEHAVEKARELAQPGDAVLLSPACASFDMYRNFEERGAAFVRAVCEGK